MIPHKVPNFVWESEVIEDLHFSFWSFILIWRFHCNDYILNCSIPTIHWKMHLSIEQNVSKCIGGLGNSGARQLRCTKVENLVIPDKHRNAGRQWTAFLAVFSGFAAALSVRNSSRRRRSGLSKSKGLAYSVFTVSEFSNFRLEWKKSNSFDFVFVWYEPVNYSEVSRWFTLERILDGDLAAGHWNPGDRRTRSGLLDRLFQRVCALNGRCLCLF